MLDRKPKGEMMNWRTDPDEFVATCKADMNLYFDDFTIADVKIVDNTPSGWVIAIQAFKNDDPDLMLFVIPEITITHAMRRGSSSMTIWRILHRMVGNAFLTSKGFTIL